MPSLLEKLFGTRNDRELRRMESILVKINTLEKSMGAKSDDELKGQTARFRERYANGESLDRMLPEAFATVREAAIRTIGQRHFDVQMLGGIVLHRGKIAEMRTGEGKTLTATGPLYLNGIAGKGTHLITVNEYLANHQAEWMGQIYRYLGMEVGCVVSNISDTERRAAYAADITYGTNNEFGFDYLRDNMKVRLEDFVQRGHNFAIVDEVDSILIDEARTPLIISGPSDMMSDKYITANDAVRGLRRDIDYTVDEKGRSCALTEEGIQKVEKRLGVGNLYDPEHMELVHSVNNALRAQVVFRRDENYIVKDGQVIIVDEFTGRLMQGRRYSDGLHQALEAKENVQLQAENQTLATVTLQNYFRMYQKLAGMTGTADTEAVEFHKIYKLDVVVVPTNRPMVRQDNDDVLFFKQVDKFNAVVDEIEKAYQKGQPVLVGTVSIEKSELLSELLKKRNIDHEVLNAKNHKREAQIIAEAGQRSRVTLSTNMAGRGTDIILGKGVSDVGGLYVIGTERHESRRIDNQLRGRAGRQGDPGESKFFLSWEDDLLRRFNTKSSNAIMQWSMAGGGVESPMLTKVIGQTQKRVEGFNYDIRKHLLEYDDVLNQQRKTVYAARLRVLNKEDIKDMLLGDPLDGLAAKLCDEYNPPSNAIGEFITLDFSQLERYIFRSLNTVLPFSPQERAQKDYTRQEFQEMMGRKMREAYAAKETLFGSEQMREIERWVMLQNLDQYWKDHLLSLDHLRDGIGLRGYGQRDPLQEYKREAFTMFQRLVVSIKEDSVQMVFRLQPNLAERFASEAENQALKRADDQLSSANALKDGTEENQSANTDSKSDKKEKKKNTKKR